MKLPSLLAALHYQTGYPTNIRAWREVAPKKPNKHDHERLQKAELKRQKKREKALKHRQGGEA